MSWTVLHLTICTQSAYCTPTMSFIQLLDFPFKSLPTSYIYYYIVWCRIQYKAAIFLNYFAASALSTNELMKLSLDIFFTLLEADTGLDPVKQLLAIIHSPAFDSTLFSLQVSYLKFYVNNMRFYCQRARAPLTNSRFIQKIVACR